MEDGWADGQTEDGWNGFVLGVDYSRAVRIISVKQKLPVPHMSVKRQVSLSLPDNISLLMTPFPPIHQDAREESQCPHD